MHGACTRGGLRSGDVLKPSRGAGVGRFSQIQTDAQRSRLRDMFNPFGSMSWQTLPHLKSGLAAGALVAALTSAANAQSTLLPELLVISPSLTPIEASKTGSSVTVMTGEEARSTGFSQLSDVMRTFPGVAVNQSGARGSLTQLRVRGAEANQLLVMIDGVPANAVGDGEYNFADIPLDDIERIELLRGPQSGLYGANAQSGVLTIETKSGRGLTKPEFNGRFELGTQRAAEGAATFRGAVGPVYGSTTVSYATTNGFNIARDGNELDGAKRAAVTSKVGVDLTPYFNVEGFFRHLQRNAEYDPQDPFFVNNGLVIDAPGYSTRIGETLARVQGTLKLFDDRWIQSMKWTGSRTGTINLRELHANLELARHRANLDLQEHRIPRQQHRGRREAPHHRPPGKPARAFLVRQQHPCVLHPGGHRSRALGYARSANSVGGEYVLDLLRTGTTISIAQRQDFNEPFEDEYTWRYSISQRLGDTGARLHSSVGRGVTNPSFFEQFGFITSYVPAQSQPRAGKLDRLGCRLGAAVLERSRVRRRDLFQLAAGARDRPEVAAELQDDGRKSRRPVDAAGRRGDDQVPAVRLADARRHLHLYGCARRQGPRGDSAPAACGVGLGHRAVRSGARQGDAERHLQRPDEGYDLHLPVLDHHA